MKTEDLNEYIFADLVYKFGQMAWKARVKKMEDEGNENAFRTTTLSEDDLRQGLELLDWYRSEGLRLLAEPRKKPYKYPEAL